MAEFAEFNGLLAADLLQKQPGAGRRPTVDCAFPVRGPSPDRRRTRRRPSLDIGPSGKAGAPSTPGVETGIETRIEK
jgi:hypothetical protein